MKRISKLYNQIISIENLRLADTKARKGKSGQYGIAIHDRTREDNLLKLHFELSNKTFKTSEYTVFKIYDPKERDIYRLPYYPDRIVHHAIMNILEPIFITTFTRDTYSCIKGRGIHGAADNLKKALKDIPGTKYCLKFDIRKFYESVNHAVLKILLRKKFKDNDLLWLLDEIIDSADGVPIGNYLSQYFANFYMSYFDHWVKEDLKIKYYFRYADDIVILSADKSKLHEIRVIIANYLYDNLKLTIKNNYQVFPVSSRSIDFLGYKFYHTHTLLRKSIKKAFARMIAFRKNAASIASYNGWAAHCSSKNLLNKLLHETV